jgi:hypothetical protein
VKTQAILKAAPAMLEEPNLHVCADVNTFALGWHDRIQVVLRQKVSVQYLSLRFNLVVTPEPDALTLLLIGLTMFGMMVYRRNALKSRS